ncbi:hypothetical protein DVH05_007199 [Phytophthora capsici]|nr:hypothetical protein DVH05_007199 [Phytophthora capsici]
MNSITGPLLPNGYPAVGLVLPDRVIHTLLAEAKARTYSGVFNRVGGGDDPYRQQSRVDSAALSPALLELRKALAVVIGMLHPGWKPGVFSFMRSKPGGTEQEAPRGLPRRRHSSCPRSPSRRSSSKHGASFAAQYEASSHRRILRCQGRQQRAHCGNSRGILPNL